MRLPRAAVVLGGATLGFPQPPPPDPAPPAVRTAGLQFATVDVATLWDHPAFAPVRYSRGRMEFAWAVRAAVGLSPAEIERIALVWHPAHPDEPFVAVTSRRAVAPTDVSNTIADGTRQVSAVDARTYLIAPRGASREVREAVAAELPAVRATSARHAVTVGFHRPGRAPHAWLPAAVRAADSAELTIDVDADHATARLTATYATPAAASAELPRLTNTIQELVRLARAAELEATSRHPTENSDLGPLWRLLGASGAGFALQADGAKLGGAARVKLRDLAGAVVQAAPDAALAPRGSAAAVLHLKQITLALHSYHDEHEHLPGNVYAADGRSLLSWRVRILPFLNETDSYRRFRLTEPWDSPANLAAARACPRPYQIPGRATPRPGETYFRAFTSPKNTIGPRAWLTDGDPKGPTMSSVTNADGLSNTLFVAEAAESVPWAKPDDLPFDNRGPLPRLGGPSGTFAAAFGDGTVRLLCRPALGDAALRAIITMNGNETLSEPGGGCGLGSRFRR